MIHVPTGRLAVLAQRLGKVWASPSTWYRLVRQNGWRRPRLRVRHERLRLLDGTRAYLHAVIDNFSRRILAWRVADTFAPVNSVAVRCATSRQLESCAGPPGASQGAHGGGGGASRSAALGGTR